MSREKTGETGPGCYMTNTGGITDKNLAQKDLAARTAVTQSCSSRSPNGISSEDARHACATGVLVHIPVEMSP